MTPAGRLLAGLALSLSAHISLAVVVPLVIGPDPVAPQPRPPSKLRIETQSLARSQAVQSPAEGTLAQAKPTAGQALSTGAIRQSRATRATPTAQTVPSQPPAQSRVAARTADADLIPAAVPASHQGTLRPERKNESRK